MSDSFTAHPVCCARLGQSSAASIRKHPTRAGTSGIVARSFLHRFGLMRESALFFPTI
jgi:hypothetical protein